VDIGDLGLQARPSPHERPIAAIGSEGPGQPGTSASSSACRRRVDTYRGRLMTKLSVHDVTALVRLVIRGGLIEADGN